MKARRYLEIQSETSAECPLSKCGTCTYRDISATVAQELLIYKLPRNAIRVWDEEVKQRWENTKFFKLWTKERAAGREPRKAFKKKGWQT
jgi:hypothetical protein